MQRDGNICKWYLNMEGCCFLNGCECYNPFSTDGCEIQVRDVFFRNPPVEYKHYEPDKTNTVVSINEIKRALGIKKGDIIADWIIPYEEIDATNVDMSTVINDAKEQVREKFDNSEIEMNFIKVFHNVEILSKQYGIYVIGVNKSNN